MTVLIKTLQVILALSILIIIHELGHFSFAKLFGIRVEKFYLFFDVKGKALLRWRHGETEYGIGWLPLGGYCKIAGMVDESMDLEQLKREPQSWEFRTHPAWQRLLVMAGGVLYNFIFAILAYSAIAGIWGESYIPNNDDSRIYASALAEDMGFRTGDRILAFDEYQPDDFGMLQADLVRGGYRKASVLRGTDTLDIYIDRARTSEMLSDPSMFALALPFVIDSVMAGSPNTAALQHGDRVRAFGGTEVSYLQDAARVLVGMKGSEVTARLEREGVEMEVPVSVDSLGRIGVYIAMPAVVHRSYNILQCIPAGLKMTGQMISGYLDDLKMVATPSTGAYKSVGSFIAIGQIFPAAWDWGMFLSILALLSIMLGVMNLLPIPGLDGGHILFTIYEMITGRKPSEQFLVVAQMIGMILLLALMFLAFGNDITRLIK